MALDLPSLIRPSRDSGLRFDVIEATSRWERRRAARVPWDVYRRDRHWTPPLLRELSRAADLAHNARLVRAPHALFLGEARNLSLGDVFVASLVVWAERGVGTGSFGMFETINEPDLAGAMFHVAETWLWEHVPALAALRGPASLDPFRLPGLLVDGFDAPAVAFLPYNPPYYPEMVAAAGYEPAQAWQAYALDLGAQADSSDPDVAAWTGRVAAASCDPALAGVVANLYQRARPEGDPVGAADAAPHWPVAELAGLLAGDGAVELGQEGRLAVRWLRRRMLVAVAYDAGRPIGAAMGVPDIGAALRHANGRLLLAGWLPYRLSLQRTRQLCVLPAAVLPAWQGQGIESALYGVLTQAALRRGWAVAIIGPHPVDDRASAQAMVALGARVMQTYQVYEKKY